VKNTVPIAATILLAALVLTGCSAGSLPGTSSSSAAGSKSSGSSGSGSGSNSGPNKNYSADDLVAILKKVETIRGISGTIKDDAQIKAAENTNPGQSLTDTFASEGGTIAPAVCGTLLDQLIQAGDAASINTSLFTSASLDASSDIISIGSSTSSETAGIISKVKGIMGQVVAQCGDMTLNISGTSAKFTVVSAPVTSNASQTFAFEEDFTVEGQLVKTLTVEAVYGNLLIGDAAISTPSTSRQEANINAVVAAANG
jgi:hypothetical protein